MHPHRTLFLLALVACSFSLVCYWLAPLLPLLFSTPAVYGAALEAEGARRGCAYIVRFSPFTPVLQKGEYGPDYDVRRRALGWLPQRQQFCVFYECYRLPPLITSR